MEIWLPITGYEGLYEVSNLGRVRSLDRMVIDPRGWSYLTKGRLLKPISAGIGYHVVNLSREGVKRFHYIHRLVGLHFLIRRDEDIQINHIDLNRQNNVVTNLEWCTPVQNNHHSAKHGRHHASTNPQKARKLNIEIVDLIRSLAIVGHTQHSIAARFGVCQSFVSNVINNKRWKRVI